MLSRRRSSQLRLERESALLTELAELQRDESVVEQEEQQSEVELQDALKARDGVAAEVANLQADLRRLNVEVRSAVSSTRSKAAENAAARSARKAMLECERAALIGQVRLLEERSEVLETRSTTSGMDLKASGDRATKMTLETERLRGEKRMWEREHLSVMAECAQVERDTELQRRQSTEVDQQVCELRVLLKLETEELVRDEQHARATEARFRDSVTNKECFLEGATRASVREVEAASAEAERCESIKAGLKCDVDAAHIAVEELSADLAAMRLESVAACLNAENECMAFRSQRALADNERRHTLA